MRHVKKLHEIFFIKLITKVFQFFSKAFDSLQDFENMEYQVEMINLF